MVAFAVAGSTLAACRHSASVSHGAGIGPAPSSSVDQALYALGAELASNVEIFSLTPIEIGVVEQGLDDALNKRTLRVDVDKLRPEVSRLASRRKIARSEEQRRQGREYLQAASTQPNARQLPSGVVVSTLHAGTGATPAPTDRVKMNYEGRLIDGTVFDSSARNGGPAEFHLQSTARCWIDALQVMRVGERARLICPSNLAYGEAGNPPLVPGGATVIFDVELLGISSAALFPPPPLAP